VSHYARAMTWLVTGGVGYIGAHVVRAMVADGMDVVVLDDLSTGDPRRVPETPLVVGSVRDRELVSDVLRDHHVDGVMHIAGKKQVGESRTRSPPAGRSTVLRRCVPSRQSAPVASRTTASGVPGSAVGIAGAAHPGVANPHVQLTAAPIRAS